MHKRLAQHALLSDLYFNAYTTQHATQIPAGKVGTTAPGVTGEPGIDSQILASHLTMTVVHEGMSRLCYQGNKQKVEALVEPFVKRHMHVCRGYFKMYIQLQAA